MGHEGAIVLACQHVPSWVVLGVHLLLDERAELAKFLVFLDLLH